MLMRSGQASSMKPVYGETVERKKIYRERFMNSERKREIANSKLTTTCYILDCSGAS